MKRQEKLILLIVALLVLSKLGLLAKQQYLAFHYGASTLPVDVRLFWIDVSRVLKLFVNVGAAIWLIVEARAAAFKTWIWALFGLFLGLLGVALFYLIQLFMWKLTADSPNQSAHPPLAFGRRG